MKMKFRLCVSVLFFSLLFVGCKHANEKHTDSGMKYILYTENPGPKAKVGDFVTIEMVYKTESDSVLFDSRQNKMPMRFQLQQPKFIGGMEEGLTYLAVGDSATFFVSTDSMVQKIFSKLGGSTYVRPDFLKAGSFLKFDMKLLRIQSELDAAEEMYRELDKQEALEKSAIKKYVDENHIVQQPDSMGMYIIKNAEGKGVLADTGKIISVKYTGKFLNGEIFDSNLKEQTLYTFKVGAGEAIKGWDIAFKKFRQGDKITMIVPSDLAFGEEGLRNKMNGSYVIPPYCPLLFEVEIVSVK